jgi:hypothetical protein
MYKLIMASIFTLLCSSVQASTFNIVWDLNNPNSIGNKTEILSEISQKVDLPITVIDHISRSHNKNKSKNLHITIAEIDNEYRELNNSEIKKILMSTNLFKDVFMVEGKLK